MRSSSSRVLSLVFVTSLFVTACKHDGGGKPGADLAEPNGEGDLAGVVSQDGGEADLGKPVDPCATLDCGDHGHCAGASVQTAHCECDTGYGGDTCGTCDTTAGFVPDGTGKCTKDPCEPNPCAATRPVCTASASGAAECSCHAGDHLEGDVCVVDTTCQPTTCSDHGTCSDGTGSISCQCNTGYIGTFCASCDTGYHADGAGGCTNDPCLPNPCTAPHQTICTADGANAKCSCESGYHEAGAACVLDEVCDANSCSQHGACSVTSGVRACACSEGYTGAACADCAGGFHADGSGGCTSDPCLPNPCSAANQNVCTAMGTLASCGCNVGYHSDGVGGCSNDPCVPNLCAAQNKACRVTAGGAAECYTPPCDDQNPCTADTLVDGVCHNDPLANGGDCATTLCKLGQKCTAGVCGGGTTRVCDDNNPCTQNSCDAVMGCKYTNDNGLVPDDGKSCTTDTCSNGVPSHAVNHASCNDNLFCNGTESCEPSNLAADSNGCVHKNAPVAPIALGANECSHYECNEGSDSFVLIKQAAGTGCNDGIACTTGDQCQNDGACRGTLVGSCALTCSGPGQAVGTINLLSAKVGGNVTLNGAELPTSTGGSDVYFYLVDRETGSRHLIDTVDLQYQYSGPYTVLPSDKTYTATVSPGVYDLLYARGISTYTPQPTAYYTSASDNYADGYRYLQKNVVIGPGYNQLDLNLPTAKLSGALTLNHGPLLTSTGGSDIYLYLVDRETGSRHLIDTIDFQYQYTGPYTVLESDKTYSATVTPGTYDLLYARGISTYTPTPTAYYSAPTDNYADGYHYLQKNLVIGAGSNTLDIDLPSAKLAGDIRLNAAALTTSTGGSDVYFYLVDRETGSLHLIDTIDFQYQYTGPYTVLDSDKTYSATVMPGTYDLLYARGISTYTPQATAYYSATTDNYADGYRILQKNIVIGAGNNTLDLGMKSVKLSGNLTLNHSPLTPSTGGSDIYLYLVDRETGSRHLIHTVDFQYQYTGPYTVLDSDKSYAATVTPGTYDLLYARGISTYTPAPTAYYSSPTDDYADGYRYLQKNIVIGNSDTTLDIDIPSAKLTGSMKLNHADLPTSTGGSDIYLYLVDRETGSRHLVDTVDFQYQYTGPYTVLDSDKSYAATVMPGTYDLLYVRGISTYTPQPTAYYSTPSDNYADGFRYLQKNVVIGAGNNTLNVDFASTKIAGAMKLNGGELPTSTGGSDIYMYLVDGETGSRHLIHTVDFQYQYTGPYTVHTEDKTYSATTMPGNYRLLYTRGISTYDPQATAYYSSPTDNYADGYRYLGACITAP